MQAIHASEFQTEGEWIHRAERAVTTLLIGKLRCRGGSERLCRIRNLSESGMLIETSAVPGQGGEVAVELRCGERLEGTVAWSDERRAGVRFTGPVNIARVLADARGPSDRPVRPRSPRFAVHCPARISSNGRTIDVLLEDISQSGARLRLPRPPKRDSEVILSVPGLPSRRCTTRWVGEESAGFVFHDMIPYPDLAAWLDQRAGHA